MSQIPLDHPIVIQPEIKTDSVLVLSYIDNPIQLFANAYILMNPSQGMEITQTLTLWEGQAYIDIGNWTTEQATARIKELLNT